MENDLILHSTSLNDFKEIIGKVMEDKLRHFKPEPQQETENRYVTRREVCDKLKISLATLHYYTKDGILKGYRIGGRILYRWVEVEQALTEIETIKYKRRA
jgi:hypothetical protein